MRRTSDASAPPAFSSARSATYGKSALGELERLNQGKRYCLGTKDVLCISLSYILEGCQFGAGVPCSSSSFSRMQKSLSAIEMEFIILKTYTAHKLFLDVSPSQVQSYRGAQEIFRDLLVLFALSSGLFSSPAGRRRRSLCRNRDRPVFCIGYNNCWFGSGLLSLPI
ncbi:hypothetical protein ZWY2020_030396 [Hordeum vulgare]|nr:hypothetical protein ZWY2020_030396 [Hordeum vulgare]